MKNLNPVEAYLLQREIISGKLSTSEIIKLFKELKDFKLDIESFKEIVRATREAMLEVNLDMDALDNCGTGGDGLCTFNISTISAFVISAAGVPVAKHGNRSASGKCGSADVLEELGVKIDINSKQAVECIHYTNFTFLFAPHFHPALVNVKQARKEYGKPTYFNYLGPLLNPGKVAYQVVGVFNNEMQKFIANTLIQTGSKAVAVVSGEDGMDELSISSPSNIIEVCAEVEKEYCVAPEELGLKRYRLNEVVGGDRKENAKIFMNILKNKATPAQNDVVVLNAALGIKVAGMASDLKEAIQISQEVITSGKALEQFNKFINFTNKF